MTFAAAIRAWLGSVGACVVLLMAWVAVAQLLSGRLTHFVHNAIDVSAHVDASHINDTNADDACHRPGRGPPAGK